MITVSDGGEGMEGQLLLWLRLWETFFENTPDMIVPELALASAPGTSTSVRFVGIAREENHPWMVIGC